MAGRRAYTARIQSLPARLPLSATALCSLYLEDAAGQTLAMPSNFQAYFFALSFKASGAQVDVSSSLTSVVMVEVDPTQLRRPEKLLNSLDVPRLGA